MTFIAIVRRSLVAAGNNLTINGTLITYSREFWTCKMQTVLIAYNSWTLV